MKPYSKRLTNFLFLAALLCAIVVLWIALLNLNKDKGQLTYITFLIFSTLLIIILFLFTLPIWNSRMKKKKGEKELVPGEEDEIYRYIKEQASDGIFIASPQGNFLEINQSGLLLTGYSKEELLSLSISDLVVEEEVSPKLLLIENLALGKVTTTQRRLQHKNGSYLNVEIRNKKLLNGNIIFFAVDMASRRKSEDEIAKANERFELISRATNDAIWEWDLESGYTWGNELHQDIYGLTKEHPIPQEDEWLNRIHFEDRERIKKDFENALAGNSNFWTIEYRFLFDNGETKYIYDRTYIQRNSEGKPVRLLGSMLDITSLRKAEEAIKLSEEKYRTLVEQATDGILIGKSHEGKFIEANSAALALFGYTQNEIKNLNIQDLLLIDESEPPLKFKELQEGKATMSTRIGRHRDGSVFFVELNAKMLPNGTFLGIARNITERKKAENALRESENRVRTILATEPECIKLIGPTGELLEINPAGLEMIEAENLESVLGKNIVQIITPPYRESFERLTTDVFEGKSGILEFEIIGLKGTHRWLETHAVPFRNANGVIIAALGVTRDITKQKKVSEELRLSEEKYRLLFSSSPLPMWVFEKSTLRFLDVNEAAIIQYGFTREEFLHMTIAEIRPPEYRLNLIAKVKEFNGALQSAGNWIHQKKDGGLIDVEVNFHDIIYNQKEARLVLANDITERKNAQQLILESSEQLRQLTARLQEIREEERIHMAHEIHDELGQRLTVLKMDISWLNNKLKTDDEVAKGKIKNTLDLINGTIKIVRKIATDLRPGILDDLGLIPALEWQSREFGERSGINVQFHSNMSEITFPDLMSTALFRVFQESLTNIGRHSEALHVESELQVMEEQVILTISDDGKGFDTATLGNKKTLGILGMKERINGIGGAYTIDSTLGKGTMVTVRIPLKINQETKSSHLL